MRRNAQQGVEPRSGDVVVGIGHDDGFEDADAHLFQNARTAQPDSELRDTKELAQRTILPGTKAR